MRSGYDISALLERFYAGQVAAAARLITILENGGDDAEKVLDGIFSRTDDAYRVGLTGPPGAGKSSLLYQITKRFRKKGRKIGIIAIDPTSPFSGGALLGDRIRMQSLSEDPDVFVRSLASRGSLGGISNCTDEVTDLLDAFGKDLILIETVGVGQSELEISEKAHTVVVVLVPESGDGIQAMKAGLMEIGDIFVMNKSDHKDAEMAAAEIANSLRLKDIPEGNWNPRVILTSARENTGIDELVDVIEEHRSYLEENGLIAAKRREILFSRVRNALMDRIEKRLGRSEMVREIMKNRMDDVYNGILTPYALVHELEKTVKIK
ncbi:MAG: methylmalonyl Co-A mutase-associated GTPase MeaB [Candidatus Krumholzibacteriota bacterium]|nr:methylmalonyl Co-A mutase-associated GTPase MeaB [Candidatus Krumholzibacteriota bacterium]